MNIFQEVVRAFVPGQDGCLFMWVLAAIALAALLLSVERVLSLNQRLNVDAQALTDKLKSLVEEKKLEEAYRICLAAGKRALPRVLGAGINMASKAPELVRSAMEEESLHLVPRLERRVPFILMFGNVSTLLGLMGTIYGLILSFAAVARPDVAAVEKSSLLASGISTAMNTTLLGLIIAVPCIMMFSMLRARIDAAVQEIDRFSVSLLKSLLPETVVQKGYRVTARRMKEEADTEPNIAPMMNLMVILIPLLLTSAEFVKVGAIEIKLPESNQGGGGGGGGGDKEAQELKLNLGVVVSDKGFTLFHHFKAADAGSNVVADTAQGDAEIGKKDGEFDYEKLNAELAEVKRKAMIQLLRTVKPDIPDGASLYSLCKAYAGNEARFAGSKIFPDHESIKIVAENTIKYQTIVSLMDAARGTRTPNGQVTMFPNVSLAGGIVH